MNISSFNKKLLSASLLVCALVIGDSAIVHSSDTESTSQTRARASAVIKEKIEGLNKIIVTETAEYITSVPASYQPERDALRLGAFVSLFEGKPINSQAVLNLGEEITYMQKTVAGILDTTKNVNEAKNEQFNLFYLTFTYNLFTGTKPKFSGTELRTRFDEEIAEDNKIKARVEGLLEQLTQEEKSGTVAGDPEQIRIMMKKSFIKKIKEKEDEITIYKAMRSFITSE